MTKQENLEKTLIEPQKNLGQWLRHRGYVHSRVLLLFWYMKPQWQYIKSIVQVQQIGGYIWPHYEARDEQGHFSVIMIPGPGSPLMEMILHETISLGARSFILWGSVARIKETWPKDKAWLMPNQTYKQTGAYIDSLTMDENHPVLSNTDLACSSDLCSHPIWCIDNPYSFTHKDLFSAIQKKCAAVDMESYAFTSALKKLGQKGLAIYYPRDTLSLSGWSLEGLQNTDPKIAKECMQRMSRLVLRLLLSQN